jgi:hypothetical protein
MKRTRLLLTCLVFALFGAASQAQELTQSAASPDSLIGQIIASDPDTAQSLTYVIMKGNEDGLFNLDPVTGLLYWHKKPASVPNPVRYELVIKVTDNGIPPLSSQAKCTVLLHP